MLWLFTGLTIGILNGPTLHWTINRLRLDAALIATPLMAVGLLLRLGFTTMLLVIASQQAITQEMQELAAGAGMIGMRNR
jgi:hypothetical protein